jgi:dTDP-glucose 4,6-dehydratase/UDP-glucose 4-epimerase
MRILIIGSKGFIGQHLKTFLTRKNQEVWGADIVADYAHPERYFLIDPANTDFHFIFKTVQFDICIN